MGTTTQRLAYVTATWFGCGHAPRAPGTLGSLGAVPLHFALCLLPAFAHGAAVFGVTLLGVWAAGVVARQLDDEDPSRVVIDEVAGVSIALGVVREQPLWIQLLAFAAFRFFDIAKPPPIRQAEHLKPPGLGIMADDLVAGVAAGALAATVAALL